MLHGLLLALIVVVPPASAAAAPEPATGLPIGYLEDTHANGTLYRFPQIGGGSVAAARINTFLQTQELQRLPGRYEASAFEAVWPTDSPNGITSLDYTLAFDQPGILSVELRGLYYGAYESAVGGRYHFDARTGEPITLRSLMTPEGLAKLDAEITRSRLRQVDDFLAGRALAGGVQLRSDPADAEEQQELYRECRSSIASGHPVVDDELALGRDSLRLLREPCAPHVLRALDELELVDLRDYESIGELLNDYGRCLLIARRASCPRRYTGIDAGVRRGAIGGRHPITLVVEQVSFDGRVRATYTYDTRALPIGLDGAALEDGGVRLDEGGEPPARFDLRVQPDGRLLGTWTQEGKPPLEVELR